MSKLIAAVFTLCLGLVSLWASAQNPAAQPSPATPKPSVPSATAPTATARPGDVDSVEHIIAAVYDVISGSPGPRDWDRFRSLYYPGARMIPSRRDDKGVVTARVSSPDEYATRAQDFFSKEGFFENSVANRVETWDHIAHVWSTYESRHAKGEKPFARGINSFQLFN
ncbi:MAG: nuclear transport factor 2 family protein, partial [Candidatus Angelobacter sp.]